MAEIPSGEIEPGQPWTVDLFRPGDAGGVRRLFLSVYGKGYPIRVYLDPERLTAENAAGNIISSVARTVRGDIVGHNALFRSAPYPGIYESGAGLVHSAYRGGKGIFSEMVAHGQNVAAKAFSVEAIFGESVCNHVFSQKMTHKLGWRTHAVEVDLMPASAYSKEGSADGRVSSLLDAVTLRPKPLAVHVPSVYGPALEFIYEGFDDKRVRHASGEPIPADRATAMETRIFDFAQVARMAVTEAGSDFKSVLEKQEDTLKAKGIRIFQLWLNLSWPWIGEVADLARTKGYFLGGVLPRWFDQDGLLMQKILGTPRWEEIQVFFDRARVLIDMVRQDWQNSCRNTG